jgi:serine/threonine-protein kinase RsbW
MSCRRKTHFSLTDSSLEDAIEFVEAFCDCLKIEDDSVCFKVRLIYEELVSNIYKHSTKLNTTFFDVVAKKQDSLIELRIKYDGEAFDPTSFTDERLNEPFSQNKKEGGLGLFLVFNMSKDFTYERENGFNIINVKI